MSLILYCYILVIYPIAIAVVTLEQATYSVDEDDGPAQPVLILSNPLSTNITVQVRDTSGAATSESAKIVIPC